MRDATGVGRAAEPTSDSPGRAGEPEVPATRAGYVAVVGPPNVGKSTLLNALLGTKLSIVTPRAQTTWRRVTGIDTRDEVQMVFLDTPGLLEVRDLLQRSMLEEAHQALRDADVVLLVLDATRPPDEGRTAAVLDALALTRAPRVVAVNKVDQALQEDVGSLLARAATQLDALAIPISALHGTGLEPLRTALAERLPLSPFLYPRDDIASQPVRFFAAELIRETVFERYRQEIPYAAFCVVEEFREEQRPVYIGATLYVERASQKGILVGVGGAAIRDLGRAARQKIETFLGEPVYLDLWVKALPGWRRKRGHLARFGFRVPEDHERSR